MSSDLLNRPPSLPPPSPSEEAEHLKGLLAERDATIEQRGRWIDSLCDTIERLKAQLDAERLLSRSWKEQALSGCSRDGD